MSDGAGNVWEIFREISRDSRREVENFSLNCFALEYSRHCIPVKHWNRNRRAVVERTHGRVETFHWNVFFYRNKLENCKSEMEWERTIGISRSLPRDFFSHLFALLITFCSEIPFMWLAFSFKNWISRAHLPSSIKCEIPWAARIFLCTLSRHSTLRLQSPRHMIAI